MSKDTGAPSTSMCDQLAAASGRSSGDETENIVAALDALYEAMILLTQVRDTHQGLPLMISVQHLT